MNTQIIVGDCLDRLKELPESSVQCCITSPPYWGLRNYQVDDQLGQEETPEEFVTNLVEVFREVRRVLRDDGTLWLNLGDSYNGSGGAGGDYNTGGIKEGQPKYKGRNVQTLKPKDLVGIPWNKPNPMPESVKDRCTKSHEYIFLLTKSRQYYYDHEAIKERAVHDGMPDRRTYDGKWKDEEHQAAFKIMNGMRNKRSVWTVTTKPYKGAHFAVFPEKLIEPCVLAGCPKGETILDPFAGSGTTGLVAKRHGCNFIGIELNPEYAELARNRIAQEQEGMFS